MEDVEQPPRVHQPTTMYRTLILELPESLYCTLEQFAASEGESPGTIGTKLLIDAIQRLADIPAMCSTGRAESDVLDRPTPAAMVSAVASSLTAVGRQELGILAAPRSLPASHTARPGEGLGIVWEGPQLGLHSFAQVNREFCLRLIERGHELALIPSEVRRSRGAAVPGAVVAGRAVSSIPRAGRSRPRASSVAAFVHPPAGRALGDHAALGVREPASVLDRPDDRLGRRGLGLHPLRPGLLHLQRRPRGPGARRALGGRSPAIPSRGRRPFRSRPRSRSNSSSSGGRSTARGSMSS